MHALFVGVDAGASHTTAALARDHEVLRTVSGDGANPHVSGAEAAADAIAAAIQAVLDGESAAAIGVGAAGAGAREVADRLSESLRERFPSSRVAVCHDARIALRAVLPHGDGIVLIAGTGSIAYAEVGGESFRAGGYGYLLRDEGSGYALGAAALRESVDAGDRRALEHIYQSATPVAEIAARAPALLARAERGDEGAMRIVREAVAGLYELVRRVVERSDERGLRLAFSGGLLRERNVLVALLQRRIAESPLHVAIVESRMEPYLGALAEARRLVNES
jgi:glucosamine kinase